MSKFYKAGTFEMHKPVANLVAKKIHCWEVFSVVTDLNKKEFKIQFYFGTKISNDPKTLLETIHQLLNVAR